MEAGTDRAAEPVGEDLDVHKRAADRGDAGEVTLGMLRRPVFAMSELFRGLSLASAEAFGALSEALASASDDEAGLRRFADGISESNQRYLERLTTTGRRFVDQVAPQQGRSASAGTPEIDYDRLAKLVAEELRRGGTGTGSA
jgi:hypothetical protein